MRTYVTKLCIQTDDQTVRPTQTDGLLRSVGLMNNSPSVGLGSGRPTETVCQTVCLLATLEASQGTQGIQRQKTHS